MAVAAAVLLALAVVFTAHALPQSELSMPSKALMSIGNEPSYIIDNEHVTNHSKLIHQDVREIPDRSLLENASTIAEVERDEIFNMGSQEEGEPAVRMLPRTTNRKLPFRRKDLRKQRRKKIRSQKSSKKQQEELQVQSDIKEADATTNVSRLADSETVPNENDFLGVELETDAHPTNVTAPKAQSASEKNVTDSGMNRNSVRSRLKLRNNKKSNSFRPTMLPSTPTAKSGESTSLGNQSHTTQNPKISKSITRSSRGRSRFPNLEHEELMEDRNPSPGGPRPPTGLRNNQKKARRRKKHRKLKENSVGHISDVFPSISYPVYSTVQPKQFDPTFSDVAHVHSTGKPRRKLVSRKQIKRRPISGKINKDHVDRTSRQEIPGRSEILNNNNNLAVSFQQTYTPRDFGSSQSSYQTPTPSTIPGIPTNFNLPQIPNNSILPVSPHTPQPPSNNFALSSEPLPPPNRFSIQNSFQNPIRNYVLPSNSQPPQNFYGTPNSPPNFNPNFIATTPRGRFGSPPLGTPPPTFAIPNHPSDRGITQNPGNHGISSGANHGSFWSNQILPVPDKPFNPVVNVVPPSHPQHPPFRSSPFANSRQPLLTPNLRSEIHNIPRPPQNVPPPGQFTRNNVFPNNFRNTEVSQVHNIRNSLFNSPDISFSPVAVSHQSRIFPGLESPQSHSRFNSRPPSFREGTPTPFHEQSSPEGSFGPIIRSPSVRGGTPRPFNPRLSLHSQTLPQISTAAPHHSPFQLSGFFQPSHSNSPRPSRPNQSPSQLRSPVSQSPQQFSTSSFTSSNHIFGTESLFGMKETSGHPGTNTIIENINNFRNEIDYDDDQVVNHENSRRPQSNEASSHFKLQPNQNSLRNPTREHSNPTPEPPSYHFQPPPSIINTFRDHLAFTESPSFQSASPAPFFPSLTQPPPFHSPTQAPSFTSSSFHLPTTPPTLAPSITQPPAFKPFSNAPLPPTNIEFSSEGENSLPVINTFHHLNLDSLQPPFESVEPEITSHKQFHIFSIPSTPKIPSGTSPEPLRTFFNSLFTTPQTITENHDSLFTTPAQISSTIKRHPLKPMSDFQTTSSQPFQSSVSFSQTTPEPFTNSRSVTTPFSATADWLAAFRNTNNNPTTLKPFSENQTQGISSFNRQVTHNLKVQNSFGTSITAQPFTIPSTKSFRPTTEHPVLQKMEDFHFKKQQIDHDETLTPLSPLSKPIQPHMTHVRGRFRNLFQNSIEHTNGNSFIETDSQNGLRPLTSAEQTFRPINPPSQILRNSLGFQQQIDNNKNKFENTANNNEINIKFHPPNIEMLHNSQENGGELLPLHQNKNQNAFAQGSSGGFIGISPSQFLSSPAPSADFFNERFREQSLPTLPPSPHMLFTNSFDEGNLFTDLTPAFPTQASSKESLKLSLKNVGNFFNELKNSNSIDGENLFTAQEPVFPTNSPSLSTLRQSLSSVEQHFFNSNSLENPTTQEVIVLTSDENDPSSKIPQSLLDILDFSKFKGRSFIFFRNNNHEYSVVFPMSKPMIGSSPEQFLEALASEESPVISLNVNDFNQNTIFHHEDDETLRNGIDEDFILNDIGFHHPPSRFDDTDFPSPPVDSTSFGNADQKVLPINQSLQPPLLD